MRDEEVVFHRPGDLADVLNVFIECTSSKSFSIAMWDELVHRGDIDPPCAYSDTAFRSSASKGTAAARSIRLLCNRGRYRVDHGRIVRRRRRRKKGK